MSSKEDTEARHVAQSRHSKTAGRLLQHARQATGMSQTEFAASIARRLGIPSLGQPALSGWEVSTRAMPAAALIAAAELARSHGFNLGQEIDNELGPHKVPQRTVLSAALRQMADALKGEAADSLREAADALDGKA